MPYAENTSVSIERSIAEIQQTLRRYGATSFGYLEQNNRIAIAFEMRGRRVRFTSPLPSFSESERTPERRIRRSQAEALKAHEARLRERYRALLLVIKAKLESVTSGIETFDEAFMAHLVLPNGQTVGEWGTPQIEVAYASGHMPALLPSGE